jgi:hypothetical protein
MLNSNRKPTPTISLREYLKPNLAKGAKFLCSLFPRFGTTTTRRLRISAARIRRDAFVYSNRAESIRGRWHVRRFVFPIALFVESSNTPNEMNERSAPNRVPSNRLVSSGRKLSPLPPSARREMGTQVRAKWVLTGLILELCRTQQPRTIRSFFGNENSRYNIRHSHLSLA